MSKERPLFALAAMERKYEKQRRKKSANSSNREREEKKFRNVLIGIALIMFLYSTTVYVAF